MKRPGEQLKLFMTPQELKKLEPHDAGALGMEVPDLWNKVSSELEGVDTQRTSPSGWSGPDIMASVRREGVRDPVTIGEEYRGEGTSHLYDGHHRTQAADEAGIQHVPVSYLW